MNLSSSKQMLFVLSVSLGFLWPAMAAPVPQDPQAVVIAKQAVSAAGGVAALRAISDYVAEGNVTNQSDEAASGRVTISAKGYDQFRIDASVSGGVRHEVARFGTTFLTLEDGSIGRPFSETRMCDSCLVLPYRQLWVALDGANFRVSYKGITEVDGRPAYELQLQSFLPGMPRTDVLFEEFHTTELFVDPASFHVLMTQNAVRKHLMRTLHYSDYRIVSGVLVPFQIREEVGGLQQRQIQLDAIRLNTELEDSNFTSGTSESNR